MALVIATCCLVLLGCGKTNPGAKVTNAESSVKGNAADLSDFSIALPDGWRVFDLTSKDFETALNQLLKDDPSMSQMAEAVRSLAAQGQIKLIAFDIAKAEKDFADNINVLILPAPANSTLDLLIEGSKTQLEQYIKPEGLKMGRTTIGGQEFGTAEYIMKQARRLAVWSFFALKGSKTYTFTFTCVDEHSTQFLASVREAMSTVVLR